MRELEERWRDGENYNLLSMELCSTHSYDNYLLLAFSGCIPFFIGAGSVQMELACNYNAQSTENGAPCERIGELIIGFLRLPSGPCFSPEMSA